MRKKSTTPPENPASILVMMREHIGDIVCTTPALRSLRKRFPGAKICVEAGERSVGALANNPHIDEVIVRRDHQGGKGKLTALRTFRQHKFDLGLVLDNCTHGPLTLWLGGCKYRVGIVRKPRWAWLFNRSVPFDRHIHEMVDNFCNVVELVGGDVSDRQTELFPQPEDFGAARSLLERHGVAPGDRIVALNPGASAPSNRWLPERFGTLIDLLTAGGYKPILLGGKQDLEIANEIRQTSNTPFACLTGEMSLMELAAIYTHCRLVITGDTGPMHIAVAMRTRVLVLFGPAVPSESGPGYVPGNRIIRNVTSCTQCTKYNCTQNRACMKAISAAEVYSIACTMMVEKVVADAAPIEVPA